MMFSLVRQGMTAESSRLLRKEFLRVVYHSKRHSAFAPAITPRPLEHLELRITGIIAFFPPGPRISPDWSNERNQQSVFDTCRA
jgi:hypothetical protein